MEIFSPLEGPQISKPVLCNPAVNLRWIPPTTHKNVAPSYEMNLDLFWLFCSGRQIKIFGLS